MDRYAQLSDIPFARIKALEARVAALESAQNLQQQNAPAGGLVERLADVWSEGKSLHPAARRAAIRHVAAWLQQRSTTHANGRQWADMLREEAER